MKTINHYVTLVAHKNCKMLHMYKAHSLIAKRHFPIISSNAKKETDISDFGIMDLDSKWLLNPSKFHGAKIGWGILSKIDMIKAELQKSIHANEIFIVQWWSLEI